MKQYDTHLMNSATVEGESEQVITGLERNDSAPYKRKFGEGNA